MKRPDLNTLARRESEILGRLENASEYRKTPMMGDGDRLCPSASPTENRSQCRCTPARADTRFRDEYRKAGERFGTGVGQGHRIRGGCIQRARDHIGEEMAVVVIEAMRHIRFIRNQVPLGVGVFGETENGDFRVTVQEKDVCRGGQGGQ